jgi:glycosyltransferase involved in cell wall biosynthesis
MWYETSEIILINRSNNTVQYLCHQTSKRITHMKDQPLVSIIINNYNYSRFLAEAINSTLNQTYAFIEIIVVDDGSSDNSCDIISSYGNQIIPIFKKNGGQASSLNEGFKASKGKIIVFLDSDDLFHSTKIEKIVNYFAISSIVDSPVIFHNLFEGINKDGFSTNEDMVSKILDLQSQEWTLLSNINQKFDRSLFSEKEICKICNSDEVYEFARRYRYIPFIGMPTSSISITQAMAERIFPLPIDGCKVSADELIVKAASLIGEVYSTNSILTQYRFHGENAWYGKQPTKEMQELSREHTDNYLNLKLKEIGKEPIFSYFNSMQAEGFYRLHFGKRSGNHLLALSFKVAKWHLNYTTFIFFVKNFVRGIHYNVSVLANSILKYKPAENDA